MPRKSWWAQLSFGVRMTVGTTASLLLAAGGVIGMVAVTGDHPRPITATGQPAEQDGLGAPTLDEDPEVVSRAAAAAEPLPKRNTAAATTAPPHSAETAPAAEQLSRARVADDRADRTGPRPTRTAAEQAEAVEEPAKRASPAKAHAQPPSAGPVVTTRTDVETRAIPFRTRVIRDPSLPRGTRVVESPGELGEETLRYVVTLTDGKPTGRKLAGTAVTREPEPRVVVFGSRHRHDHHCEAPLQICLPFGRSAPCPDDSAGRAEQPGDEAKPERRPEAGTSGPLTGEEIELLDPETLDQVRLEPAGLC